jgi:hypothetical protein
MPDTCSTFRQWLDDHRRASVARGGRALRLYLKPRCQRSATAARKPGEIINPETGEVLTNCLTVAKFAQAVEMSTRALIGHLKTLGLLQDVLEWKEVPMVQAPHLTKSEYSHRARLTPWARGTGFGVTIETSTRLGTGMQVECDLLTREGQRYVAEWLEAEAAGREPSPCVPKTLDRVREMVAREPKVSNREIAKRLCISRQAIQKQRRRLAA